MKTAVPFLLSVILILTTSTAFSKGERLQLRLHEGQEIDYSYELSENNKQLGRIELFSAVETNKWDIRVGINQKINEGEFTISVIPIRYTYNKYSQNQPNIHFDTKYPPFTEKKNGKYLKNYIFPIICRSKINAHVDLVENELSITGWDTLKSDINSQLIQTGLSPEERQSFFKMIVDEIETIQKITKEYLLKFNNGSFAKKDVDSVRKRDYIIEKNDGKLFLEKNDASNSGDSIENTFFATIDINNGLVINSKSQNSTIIKNPANKPYPIFKTDTKSYLLLKNSIEYVPEVTISGQINNSKNRFLLFQTLKDPVGIAPKSFQAPLDEKNFFSLKIPLEKEGFIMMAFPQGLNITQVVPENVIYAEPGDHIKFVMEGNDIQTVNFSGDRSIENNLINCQPDRKTDAFANAIFGFRLNPVFLKSNMHLSRDFNYSAFIDNNQLKQIENNWLVSPKFLRYITQELMMEKLGFACTVLSSYPILYANGEIEDIESLSAELTTFIDSFNVSKYYNEDGFYSRSAISKYASYMYNRNRHYQEPMRIVSKQDYPLHHLYPRQQANYSEYLKLWLAGSALVKEKVFAFSENLKVANYHDHDLWQQRMKESYDELLKTITDSDLIDFTKEKYKTLGDFLTGELFKKDIFLNTENHKVSINQLINGKPTVLYVSRREWGVVRYYFDELGEKHPDVNFIYLAQGYDYNSWKSYLERGEPVAEQLFYLRDNDESLENLFLLSSYNDPVLGFDINGNLIEQKVDLDHLDNFIHKAKNPQVTPKEIDKSILYKVIWFMAGSMLLALIGFLIFKERMRTKLRKQNQEKRLRELQLSAIRAQMNPHFLFNSLNSVQNLIQKDKGKEAHLYLSDFASLIRKVLKNSQQEEVSLAEELGTLNQYIKLEQLRFEFEYEQTVDPEIDQNHFMVPSMILQPIAENAILHGLQHKQDDKKILLKVEKMGPSIQISIEDNGIGMKASKKFKTSSNGIGLNLNEERLKIMREKYGGNYSFKLIDLTNENKEGTRVEIIIPEEQ